MPQSLVKISNRFSASCEKQRFAFHDGIVMDKLSVEHRAYVTKFAVIRLLDSWGLFCKRLIISSAIGSTYTSSGVVLPKGSYRSQSEAMIAARTTKKGLLGDEPRWHDANIALSVAKKLSVPNLGQITNALGDANSPADQIRLLRNFCAHEGSQDCYEKLEAASWRPNIRTAVVEDVLSALQVGGRMRIDLWLDDLQALAHAAVS